MVVSEWCAGVLVEPTVELPDGDQPASSAPYNTEFGEDVLVEEVAAYAERAGGFGGGEREPRCGIAGRAGHASSAAMSACVEV